MGSGNIITLIFLKKLNIFSILINLVRHFYYSIYYKNCNVYYINNKIINLLNIYGSGSGKWDPVNGIGVNGQLLTKTITIPKP